MNNYWRAMILLVIGLIYNLIAHAWENHYQLTYEALRGIDNMGQTVAVESIDDFVKKEKDGLRTLLAEIEQKAKKNPNHAPLPKELAFGYNFESGLTLTQQFLLSLRVNQNVGFPLFVLKQPGASKTIDRVFSPGEINNAPFKSLSMLDQGRALKKLLPGQMLSKADTVATGSEEPDHGLDFYLWQNNESWFGLSYGFGPQPFGNPHLSYGSQAPFHMGFYFEPKILYMAAGFLKRCYPEYRTMQFLELSRFAFATGHNYWGYRFLGIADHYLQDLTQPYHANVAPGSSALELIGKNILAMIGIEGPKRDQTQLLTNRHLGLENYLLGSLVQALSERENSSLLKILRDSSHDKSYPNFSDSYASQVVAKEAFDKAARIDELVTKGLPQRLSNPRFLFEGTMPAVNLLAETKKSPNQATKELDEALLGLMRSYGSHTRKSLSYVKAP